MRPMMKAQIVSAILATAVALPPVALAQGANHPDAATAAGSHQVPSPGTATPTPAGATSGQPTTPPGAAGVSGATQASNAAPGEAGMDWQARVNQRIEAMRTALNVTS